MPSNCYPCRSCVAQLDSSTPTPARIRPLNEAPAQEPHHQSDKDSNLTAYPKVTEGTRHAILHRHSGIAHTEKAGEDGKHGEVTLDTDCFDCRAVVLHSHGGCGQHGATRPRGPCGGASSG